MPFRHVAMFRWAAHVDGDHVQRVREAYDELATVVPGIRHHAHGTDVGISEGTFDYLVVADFESLADWRTYRDHPTHVLLVEELITGHVADRATGQFQIVEPGAEEMSPGMRPVPARPDDAVESSGAQDEESDEELLARARRAAMAEMEALLAEPDDPA